LTDVSLLSREQRMNCAIQLQLGRMPKDDPSKVTDAEAQQFMEWSLAK